MTRPAMPSQAREVLSIQVRTQGVGSRALSSRTRMGEPGGRLAIFCHWWARRGGTVVVGGGVVDWA